VGGVVFLEGMDRGVAGGLGAGVSSQRTEVELQN